MRREVHTGDCVAGMAAMEENSVDAIVTDPPYGLEFMGKEWDRLWADREPADHADPANRGQTQSPFLGAQVNRYVAGERAQAWHYRWAVEALRVLKPGGHLLAFGGTRTAHRLVCALEDAGFEIRDTICWLYGSGFPKSLDVGKAIDKAAGAEREVVGVESDVPTRPITDNWQASRTVKAGGGPFDTVRGHLRHVTRPTTAEAARWDGWGTALKPGHEPVCVARKPLSERNVSANVLRWGTGGLNVDGCRVPVGAEDRQGIKGSTRGPIAGQGYVGDFGLQGNFEALGYHPEGRWPANVCLDGEAAALLDGQSGELVSGANPTARRTDKFRSCYGDFEGQRECLPARGADSGGASRFFYCAKAGRAERNAGLEGAEERPLHWSSGDQNPGSFQAEGTHKAAQNHHPTVKPLGLMRWLVRLVCPRHTEGGQAPGGTVLDPFAGSGTTGMACAFEGFGFVGIEQDAAYAEIARLRIAWAEAEVARAPSRLQEGQAQAVADGVSQQSLFGGSR